MSSPAHTPSDGGLPARLGGNARITATTGVLCVIGHPIAHSFSPQMHNAAIAALGLDLCYVAFDVAPEAVGDAIEGMRALGIRGMNVTVPHKQAVIPHLDELSDEARAVGAVNTIANRQGHLVGYNTDVYGVLTSLRETAGLSILPRAVVVLGASGAARGIVYALATAPGVERVVVLNRTESKARELATDMAAATGREVRGGPLAREAAQAALADAGLLVNATSVGMYPNVHQSPLPDGVKLPPDLVVYDAVFNPRLTRLMQQARAAGCRAVGGIEMLVYQGARSFEIWTGITPPVDVMKRAVGA